ncbi:Digestive organ expansion factor [Galemys pyrenaicus]|uniref:U3 small nucleolar RNA-associated protein 25 homolog n=1 Tax=Galemys pyrenaicus TaxID=202257 RepID=A0A8J6A358_GALPY|nr:Digestive organ expansion factor [Galemys pyrenaicus]
MGKRAGRGPLLRALTKKQKRHLRDFGEEHPFHDRCALARPAALEPGSEISDTSSSESEDGSEPEQVSGYHKLLATLKDVSGEEEEEEDEEEEGDSAGDEAEVTDTDGGSEVGVEADAQAGKRLPVASVAPCGPADVASLSDPKGEVGAGHSGPSQQELPEEFTDTKHESFFSLETNFIEEQSGGRCGPQVSADPFLRHVSRELREKDVQAVATNPRTTQQLTWPVLGQVVFSSKFRTLETFKPPKDVDIKSLHLQKPLDSTWTKTNSPFLSGCPRPGGPFTPLQQELFLVMNSYRDLFFPERHAGRGGEEVRLVYCLHALNHVLKANAHVLGNNSQRRAQKPQRLGLGDDGDFRDQGLTRPKVLIVVPFREAALRVVQLFIQLLEGGSKKVVVSNKKRFQGEYGSDPAERPPNLKRPEDYEAVFVGNIDDHFRIGVAVLQRSIRLYAPFYSSDILIASPLGLRTIIGAEGEKQRDFDFLSSIELLVLDQADIYLMQNWEHVLHLMNHVNRLPSDPHGVDFSRVRMWSLNDWARHYRQTLLFGALQDPQINALFNKYCVNVEGQVLPLSPQGGRGAGLLHALTPGPPQVAVRSIPMTGSISRVLVQLPHVFQRLEAEDLTSVIDARFSFFVDRVLPQYRDAVMAHTLIYVPSYFDFVRLRNYFKREDLSFAPICEYSRRPAVSRARHFFLRGERQFLLLTERFHFYKRCRQRAGPGGQRAAHSVALASGCPGGLRTTGGRPHGGLTAPPRLLVLCRLRDSPLVGGGSRAYTIKGVRNLIFYELPTYAHFYSELCSMLRAGGGAEAAWTCTALYSRYDAQRLAAVVGVERAAQMLRSKKSVHLFVTGES